MPESVPAVMLVHRPSPTSSTCSCRRASSASTCAAAWWWSTPRRSKPGSGR
ncbi:hypothetical protein ACP4OV_006338 [Aristida adscensionis]